MAIKVKRSKRRSKRKETAPKATSLEGESKAALDEALERINPKPDRKTWRPMAEGLAKAKGIDGWLSPFLDEKGDKLGWEWATMWICHALACEGGDVEFANRVYHVLVKEYQTDYLTELSRARLCRDYTSEYFLARDHFLAARAVWPEGYEVNYQLGILYDMLGVPEYAFGFAESAHAAAEQYGEEAYKHQARVSYNMAVAMWQAARPYGDIKAYLHRALEEWPDYERAERLLNALPDDDEADPKGRSSMQRLTEDIQKTANTPSYYVVEPPGSDDD